MDDFVNWINQEIETRGWQYADISRHGGISKSMISRVVSEQSRPGLDFCLAVARAFNTPPDAVLRRAGLLPSLPPAVEEEREVVGILRRLPASARRTVITMLRALSGQGPAQAPASLGENRIPYDTDDPLLPELLEEYRQVPDEWKAEAIRSFGHFRRSAELRPRFVGEEAAEIETERDTAQEPA